MPSPWWTSQSTTSARRTRPSARIRDERHGDVVEQAVAAREVAPGVVRAAAQVHAEPLLERQAGRRRPSRRPSAGRARPAPPTTAARARAPRARSARRCGCARSAPASWTASSHVPRHRLGLADLDAVRPRHALAQQRVLLDREAVVLGEREAPAIVGPDEACPTSRPCRASLAGPPAAAANSSSATRAEAPAGAAQQPPRELRAAEVERRVVLPGGADAAVHGDLRARGVVERRRPPPCGRRRWPAPARPAGPAHAQPA